jgi:hypothetical protein
MICQGMLEKQTDLQDYLETRKNELTSQFDRTELTDEDIISHIENMLTSNFERTQQVCVIDNIVIGKKDNVEKFVSEIQTTVQLLKSEKRLTLSEEI